MLTQFGKLVRTYRIQRDILLGKMAGELKLSSAYVSAVETGKKNPTKEYVRKVAAFFNLDDDQYQLLQNAADNSPASVKINLTDASNNERMLVSAFARKVSDFAENPQSDLFDLLGVEPENQGKK